MKIEMKEAAKNVLFKDLAPRAAFCWVPVVAVLNCQQFYIKLDLPVKTSTGSEVNAFELSTERAVTIGPLQEVRPCVLEAREVPQ